MAATYRRTWWVAAVALFLPLSLVGAAHASASNWTVAISKTAPALAQSLDLQPPANIDATCTAPALDRTITVSWTSVAHATSYTVYESTTSATAGFSAVATGVTGTSWTTGTLKKGTYWYTVAVVVGPSTWTSPMSAPTPGRTIGTSTRCA
jgi:hypothetical protein